MIGAALLLGAWSFYKRGDNMQIKYDGFGWFTVSRVLPFGSIETNNIYVGDVGPVRAALALLFAVFGNFQAVVKILEG